MDLSQPYNNTQRIAVRQDKETAKKGTSRYSNLDLISFAVLFLVIAVFSAAQMYLTMKRGDNLPPGVPTYAKLADNLITTGEYTLGGERYVNRMPAYAILVAAAKLIGNQYWGYLLILIQGTLAFLSGVLINHMTRYLTPTKFIPALATLTYAVHAGLQWENLAMRETVVYEFFIVCFFYVVI